MPYVTKDKQTKPLVQNAADAVEQTVVHMDKLVNHLHEQHIKHKDPASKELERKMDAHLETLQSMDQELKDLCVTLVEFY